MTQYDGDLHCRQIFIDEIDKLLQVHDLEKAKNLYFASPLDSAWKRHFLRRKEIKFQKLITDEERRIETKKRHEEFLASFGVPYGGVSLVLTPRKHRITHCYSCKTELDNSIDIECNKCGWIICRCGACGCGYSHSEVITEYVGQEVDDE